MGEMRIRGGSKRSKGQGRSPSDVVAARRLEAAYRELAAARAAFAQAGRRDKRPPSSHPGAAILKANRDRLLAHPDVVGFGLGKRWTARGYDGEPVVRVYVRKKLAPDEISRDRMLGPLNHGRKTIGVDIAQFGDRLVHTASPGDSIGQIQPLTRGTIGSFATLDDGRMAAITAMHITNQQEITGPPAIAVSIPSREDDDQAPVLELDRGSRNTIDAARIILPTGFGIDWSIPGVGPINGWRWTVPGDANQGVSLYGARSNRLDGTIIDPCMSYPQFNLDQTIVVQIPTQQGDSGAAIVDGHGYVLGFLAGYGNGMAPGQRLFCPAGLVLGFLECTIP